MPAETCVENLRREFARLRAQADAALAQCTDAQFFATPGAGDNSLAVIVKHVAGNLTSRWTDFLTSDGEKPGRNRDDEFALRPEDTRARLEKDWQHGWAVLSATFATLTDDDLPRVVRIRGEPLTVLQAAHRQLAHYAGHVGQIVYVAKHHCGPGWKTLSIPRGGSANFNRQPSAYVTPPPGEAGRD